MNTLAWVLLAVMLICEVLVALDESSGYQSGRRPHTRLVGYVAGFLAYALVAVVLI